MLTFECAFALVLLAIALEGLEPGHFDAKAFKELGNILVGVNSSGCSAFLSGVGSVLGLVPDEVAVFVSSTPPCTVSSVAVDFRERFF